MAKKTKIDIEINAKGGPKLKKTTQQTDKHAKSLDGQAKASKRAHKADVARYNHEKQAILQTAPAGKNFAKMSRSMDGGTGAGGLVRAYALLAANVFALSAAFGVLSRAAQTDTLMESMKQLEVVTGQSVRVIGQELQKVSGFGMDLAESMRATSLALSAGFDSSSIKDLGEVARNAAVSLGRPMGDALDRIFRGVIKVEPELLDEIGLFVRVKEASAKYASELGIAASELTEFQKRQAFANEAITQGQDKFDAFSNIETDQFSRLASAFSDIAQSALSFVNTALKPMIDLIAGSKAVLVGVFSAIIAILAKKAIPAMGLFATSAAQAAADAVEANEDYRKDLNLGVSEQREAAEKTIKIKQDQAKKERDILMKARTEQKKDFKGQTGKGGIALQKANAKLSEKNLQGAKKIAALEAKRDALQKSWRKVNADAIDEAKDAINKEIAAEEKLLRLAKERRDVKAQFPEVKPETGTVAGATEQKLARKEITAKGIGTVVSTAEFKGFSAGVKELGTQFTTLDAQAKKAGTSIGFAGKSMFLLKGGAQLAVVGVQQLAMKLQTTFMVISILLPIVIAIAQRFNVWDERYKALSEATKKAKEQLKDFTEKTHEQRKAIEDAAEGTKKFAQANLALNRSIADTANALLGQEKAFASWSASANFGARALESLKFIVGMDKFTELTENQDDFFKGLLTGYNGLDIATKKIFNNVKAITDLEAWQAENASKRNMAETMLVEATRRKMAFEEKLVDIGKRTGKSGEEYRDAQKEMRRLNTEETTQRELLAKYQEDETTLIEAALKSVKILNPSMKELATLTGNAAEAASNLKSALEGSKDAVRDYNDSFIQSTKVDKPLANLLVIARQLEQTNTALSAEQRSNFVDSVIKGEEVFLSLLSAEQRERIKSKTNEEDMLKIIKESIKDYRERQAIYVKNATLLKELASSQKLISKLAKEESQFAAFSIKIDTQRVTLKHAEAQMLKEMKLDNAGITEAQFQYLKDSKGVEFHLKLRQKRMNDLKVTEEDILQLEALEKAEAIAATELRVAKATEEFKIRQQIQKISLKEVNLMEKLTNLQNKNLETLAKISVATRVGRRTLNPVEEAKLMIEAEQKRAEIAQKKQDIELKLIDLQFKILKAEAAILAEKARQAGTSIDMQEVENTLNAASKLQQEVVKQGYINAANEAQLAIINKVGTAFETAFTTGITHAMESSAFKTQMGFTAANLFRQESNAELEELEKKKKELQDKRDKLAPPEMQGMFGGGMLDWEEIDKIDKSLKEIEDTMSKIDLNNAQMQFLALANAVNQFATEVSKLGSGGVLAATMAEFTISFVDNINTLKDSTLTGLEATQERLSMAANMIGNLAQVIGAASANKVAQLDKEIEAEKRRDGQSKASQAKIMAMEKKKEALGRKNFKIQKGLMMAQAAMATAAAMIAAAGPPNPPFPISSPFVAAVAALGAAQMAIIAGQSYGGFTASKPDAGGPPASISVGKRSNKVDVSQGASAGELAYLTGGRGVGTTANNFIAMGGAAGLRKGYASGGVIVGEQGPEMIQPYAGFNVVPNDQLGGKPVNAHFTINAIDARGVEEVLQEQQGNIIGMIRSAANDYGQEFLEAVEVDHLAGTPKSAGGIDY